jgi:hypothetical protein
MTLPLLKLSVPDEGYSAQSPKNEVLRVESDGGFSMSVADLDGAAWMVNASFITRFKGYQYLYAFYRSSLVNGRNAFRLNLALDAPAGLPVVTEYHAHFMPGSLALTTKDGDAYTTKAQLEVIPSDDNDVGDLATINAYIAGISGGSVTKLVIGPTQESFSESRMNGETLRAIMDGPQGLYRKLFSGSVIYLDCMWVLVESEYQYFMAFFRHSANKGATPVTGPFTMNGLASMIYTFKFVPGSLMIKNKSGNVYRVGATVEVQPITSDTDDAAVVAAFDGIAP